MNTPEQIDGAKIDVYESGQIKINALKDAIDAEVRRGMVQLLSNGMRAS